MARLPDADQGELLVPRLDPGGATRARPRALSRLRQALAPLGHPGVAELLLQEPDRGARSQARARPLRAAHETEEHAPLASRRRRHLAPRSRVLRLRQESYSAWKIYAAGSLGI